MNTRKTVSSVVPTASTIPLGTREFALYDLDRNALTFYNYLA